MLGKIVRVSGLLVGLVFCAAGVAAQEPVLAITHVKLIDATGSPVLADMTVIVAGKRILQIGKSDATPLPKGTRVGERRWNYLIPRLWDMHVPAVFSEWIPPGVKTTP